VDHLKKLESLLRWSAMEEGWKDKRNSWELFDSEVSVHVLKEKLLVLEENILGSSFAVASDEKFRGRSTWMTTIQQLNALQTSDLTSNIRVLSQQLSYLEGELRSDSLSPDWYGLRGLWSHKVSGATTLDDVADAVFSFEETLRWSAMSPIWSTFRGIWRTFNSPLGR